MENQLYVSASPHVMAKDSVQKIMLDVVLALVPAIVAAIYFFGFRAGWIILLTVAACLVTEWAVQRLLKKPVTITDGSAVVTGILLAFNLPAEIPWWLPIIGSVFAIGIGKHCFGGLGYNPMNPALLGRAFLLASWPTHMTIFQTVPQTAGSTLSGISAITGATPLNVMKQSQAILKADAARIHFENLIQTASDSTVVQQAQTALANLTLYPIEKVNEARNAVQQLGEACSNFFMGNIGGCLGETSVLALLLGAAYLLYKRHIGWKIPLIYLGTVALLTWIFGGVDGWLTGDWLFHILTGGLILGAFFMATDMVTSPITGWGQIIFAFGCGVITVIIRLIGGYPEGVSYSILLMNLTVPLLNRFTRPRIFGEVK
jgi:electron transport complex protein RnfD